MDIRINLDRDFEMNYDILQREFGSDMARLNGFSDAQLSYTDFIDNFVDKQTVADASVDGNANVGHKDIVSLENEMSKPHSKLLAFNKIFYELKKKYGYRTAVEWLRNEWDGHFYLHDGYNTTMKPYCFRGDTKILTKEGICSLKELVGKDVMVLGKNHGWEPATVQHFGKDTLWLLTLQRYGVEKKIYVTGNHKWFVKGDKGTQIIETNRLAPGMRVPFNTSNVWSHVHPSPFGVAHGFYMGDGDKGQHLRANFCGDKVALLPYFTPNHVGGNEKEYVVHGIPSYFRELPSLQETPSYLYGWLAGYFAADGSVDDNGRCTIASADRNMLDFVRHVLCVLGMPVNTIRHQDRVSNLTGELGRVYILTLSSECLKEDFFVRPQHRERWIPADGKRRSWQVVSVHNTGVEDDVYCAVVPGSESFTLDGNILTHNCYAYDLEKLVNDGLYFIDNFNAKAPQHLTTYTDFVSEFISYCCNRSSGAVGLPSFLVYSFYFWKRDCDNNYVIKSPEYYRDQCFQEIVYRLNQPFLRSGVQSSFTNFSIFDRPYLEALFGGKEFPDGTFIIDYIDDLLEYQKAFMKVVSEVRSQCMMTFPVLTYALLRKDGKFVDEEFAKWCCEHNMKWGDSNFFISDDVTSLSNCCLHGDEYVLTKSDAGVRYCPIREVINGAYADYRKNMSIYHNGSWVKAKPVKLVYKDLMYRITTVNGKSTTITGNHIVPTLRGDVRADQLNDNDYLMFNTMTLDSYVNRDNNLTYEQGYVVGAYAGDGSIAGTLVTFSLSDIKVVQMLDTLKKGIAMIDANCMVRETVYEDTRLVSVTCSSKKVVEFIRRYLSGGYSNTKAFEACVLYENREFRNGIIDGWYATDGGNSNRIYSTSEMLIRTGDMICTSLGMNATISFDDSRVGEVAFVEDEKEYCHNYPVWCLRYYENTNRRHLNDVYIVRNNSIFFKVQTIESFFNNEDYVYCFEVDEMYEPYFTLPNGMITHNCRLKSDIKDLGYFNSLGNVALEVGSVKVNTINLARLSYECDTTEEYLEKLKEKAILCLKVLERVRHIIMRNVDKGLLPNYSLKLMDMAKQYNTIGIIGLYEALQKYEFIVKDEFGNVSYTDGGIEFAKDIMEVLNETKNEFTKDAGYMANIEQIPGERAASILMQKDKMLFPDEAYDLPLYGNQWIPLGIKTTMHEKIRLSAILDNACNGGSIAHINIDSPIKDFDTAWKLLNYIADEGVQYFAFNLRISACKHNHGFYGDVCPECGEPVETTYQRIVGFLVPTKTYSAERKAEFAMRDWFTIGDDL